MKDVILAACGGFVTVNMIQLHVILGWNRKPLNCDVCLSGWFFLLLYFCPGWLDVPFYMAGAMIGGKIINFFMKKTL